MAKERDSDSDRVIGEFIPGDLSCDDGKGFLLGVVVVCFVGGGGEGEGEGGDDDWIFGFGFDFRWCWMFVNMMFIAGSY